MASGPSELETLVPGSETGAQSGDSRPEPTPLRRGASIGRYVVIDTLGSGSMGIVHLAYDPELDRRVAIKLLRPSSRLGAAHIARERIVREAQALAKLSHPNVVGVHDVGVLDDRVWIAMEYVEGETLRSWLAASDRDWRDRLAVVVAAGRGLAAAHAAGFVHRDFKPDNVMVGRAEAGRSFGRVRVTDFGLARRVGQPGSTPSDPDIDVSDALTKTGAMVGTPRYMGPEQLEGKPLDAAADQFAWCITAFEALLGERPFAGDTLVELAASVTAGRVRSVSRGPVPASVHRIVRRGLEPSPDARWGSMTELLDALERAVTRRPGRSVALAVGLLACAGAVGATLGREPPRCEGAAERLAEVWNPGRREGLATRFAALPTSWSALAAEQTISGIDAWGTAWADARREACAATMIRGEQSEALMDLRMRCLDRSLDRADATLDAWSQGDAAALEDAAGAPVGWLRELKACDDADALRQAVPLPSDPAVASRVRELQSELTRLRARLDAGVVAGLAEPTGAALADATDTDFAPVLAEAQELAAKVAREKGDFVAAEAGFRAALKTAASCRDPELELRLWLALTLAVAADSGRPQEARGLELTIEVAARRAGYAPDDERVMGTLGRISIELGRYDEARDRLERALADSIARYGSDDPTVASWQHSLAIALHELADHEAAREHLEEAVRIDELVRGIDHPKTLAARQDLARTLAELGRQSEARAIYEHILETRKRTLGGGHPLVADLLVNLGTLAYDAHDDATAAKYLREAIVVASEAKGDRDLTVAIARFNLANVEDRIGDDDAALEDYEAALELFRERLGEAHPHCGIVLGALAELHGERGDLSRARDELRAALAIKEGSLGEEHPSLLFTLRALADVLADDGDEAAARDELERGLRIVQAAGVEGSNAAMIEYALARLLWAEPESRPRALKLADQALAHYEDDGAAVNVAAVTEWLKAPRSRPRTPRPAQAAAPDR